MGWKMVYNFLGNDDTCLIGISETSMVNIMKLNSLTEWVKLCKESCIGGKETV